MSDEGGEPTPRLRQGPPPEPGNGRGVLIGAAIFFVLLVGFVLTLVFTIGIHNNGVKLPPGSATNTPAASAPAPRAFWAIIAPDSLGTPAGGTAYVTGAGSSSITLPHLHAVAIGVTAGNARAYSAYPLPGCRTRIEPLTRRHFRNGNGLASGATSWTLRGHAERVSMAVSPDGTKLALVTGGARCNGQNTLAVVDLATHAVRDWSVGGSPSDQQSVASANLVWAPDSIHLAFAIYASALADGGATRLLDTSLPGRSALDAPEVLPADGNTTYGPVIWWHGQLAAFVGTSLRAIVGDRLGAVLATGFPTGIFADSVSVSPHGDWILMQAGSGHFISPLHGPQIAYGTTYRWHDGHTSLVKGNWIQPAW